MLTLARLLELAGLREDIMSRDQALRIFSHFGQPVFNDDDPRTAWINLQRKYHEGGREPNPEALTLINRAYGILKSASSKRGPQQAAPVYSDTARYEVYGWDGRALIPGYVIEATPEQFGEIVTQAMQRLRQGFKRPTSIVLRQPDKRVM